MGRGDGFAFVGCRLDQALWGSCPASEREESEVPKGKMLPRGTGPQAWGTRTSRDTGCGVSGSCQVGRTPCGRGQGRAWSGRPGCGAQLQPLLVKGTGQRPLPVGPEVTLTPESYECRIKCHQVCLPHQHRSQPCIPAWAKLL